MANSKLIDVDTGLKLMDTIMNNTPRRTRKARQTYDKLASTIGIDINGEALSVLTWDFGTKGVVRTTKDGKFALIAVDGRFARLVKLFDTLDAARAYNFACAC